MESKHVKIEYGAQSPKYLNDESVDDMLANVDVFIQGVYRDLSIDASALHTDRTPTDDSSSASCNTSPDGASLMLDTTGDKGTSVISPTTRRNLDADIERINRMCDNVNNNLRSIGIFMDHSNNMSDIEDLLNSNLISSPPSSTNSNSINNRPLHSRRNSNIQRSHRSLSPGLLAAPVIDLSEPQTQTPEIVQPLPQNNDSDDDVILVSANVPPVVDLCTPGGHQEAPRRRSTINYGTLNRRRLPCQDVGDGGTSCCKGPSSTRKRRTQNYTPQEYISKTEKTSSDISTSSITTTGTADGRTPFMCPVCMESCLQRQPTSTRCGHVFCKECIEHAIRLTHKCPMCNSKVSRTQIFRIYL